MPLFKLPEYPLPETLFVFIQYTHCIPPKTVLLSFAKYFQVNTTDKKT